MSNLGLSMQENSSGGPRPPQKPKKQGKRSKAALIIAAVVILVGFVVVGYGAYRVVNMIQASAPADDYPGPGSGEVVIEVTAGETLADIGKTLKEDDVVASVQAFTEAAMLEEDATNITPGRYLMLEQMSGADAVQRLLNPESRNENTIVLPEGLRTDQVVEILSDVTGIKESQFDAVIATPGRLPLPDWAEGTGEARVEGFLFPATYAFDKRATATEILTGLVDKFNEVTAEMDFENRAEATGYSPYEVLITASLVQAEAPPEDFDKVSRVVYNRLDPDTWGGTYGYLGFDSTINYVLKQSEINLTESDRATNSPYNTFTEQHQGLPPTPIENPGQAALEAALEPAEGDWLYFVTTNPNTGKTKFTDNYNEFLGFQNEFEAWLRNNQ
jgi:UPF0755 protein